MNGLSRKLEFYSAMGPRYLFWRMRSALVPPKLRMRGQLDVFAGRGLEIGGPSRIFADGDLLPIYARAENLDNVTYSTRTAWEGEVTAGATFVFHPDKPPGRQYVMEAAELASLPPASYDFIVSSHMLEHAANPLAVLGGWKRLLRDCGHLLLVVPHREGTFDHRRPVTAIEHLRADLALDTAEDDQTHLPEILRLHDLRRDPAQGSRLAFEDWIRNNPRTRGAHHHVFDTFLAAQMLDAMDMQLLELEPTMPWHIFVLAKRLPETMKPDNRRYLDRRSWPYRSSPFRSDRSANE